jgi:uncharacterized protein YfkK (UPF0435 family)
MKRYIRYEGDEIFRSSQKSHFLNEAVFRPDNYAKELYNIMVDIIGGNQNSKLKYDYQICKLLTDHYSKYNIVFIPEGEYYNNGYKSGINSMESGEKSLLIRVLCSLSIDTLFKSQDVRREFLKDFKQLISHELVHRGQYISFTINNVKKDLIQFSKNKTDLAYYSLKPEIMAYACLIVEELRYQDLEDVEILKFINKRENFKQYECRVYDLYKEFYGDSNVFERLLKYIYEYIKGDLTKNIVKIGS